MWDNNSDKGSCGDTMEEKVTERRIDGRNDFGGGCGRGGLLYKKWEGF